MISVQLFTRFWAHDAGLFAIRAMPGVMFVFHGSQKLFGWFGGYGLSGTAGIIQRIGISLPAASAFLAGAAEFFGGLALILGLGTRIATVPLFFTMLVVVFSVHRGVFIAQQGGMEYPLTLALALAGLGLTGGGRLTAGTLLRRRLASGKPLQAAPEHSGPSSLVSV